MPEGEITNATMLLALDQIIVAINNLSERLGACAENNGCGSCGGGCGNAGGVGTNIPGLPTDSSDPPPTGWVNPSVVAYNRKCRVANAIHQNITEWIHYCDEHGVDNFANQLIPITLALFVALLSEWIVELTVEVTLLELTIGEVAGYLLSQAIALLRGDVSCAEIYTILSDPDNQQDFICALYEPTGTESVISAYLQVCEDKGMSIANKDFVAIVFATDLAYYLFWQKEQFIEDQLAAYSPTTPCDDCDQPVWWNCIYGTVFSATDTSIDIDAALADDSSYFVGLGIDDAETWGISQVNGTFNTPPSVPESITRWSDQVGASCTTASVNPQWNEVLDHVQLGTYPSITAFAIRSGAAFRLRIQRNP